MATSKDKLIGQLRDEIARLSAANVALRAEVQAAHKAIIEKQVIAHDHHLCLQMQKARREEVGEKIRFHMREIEHRLADLVYCP